jgi:outer membrane receptor protein involved in Fe transport
MRPCLLLLALVSTNALAEPRTPESGIEEITIPGERYIENYLGTVGSMSTLDAKTIELTRATHVNETMVRVPGVWISRGSGQEHLTAIRSPVFTGVGACGEFLYLENGISIRPAGFCNINNLFELDLEQAESIEVVRGPASAFFGGNALHGVINGVMPVATTPWRIGIEGGPDDFVQARFSGSIGDERQTLRMDGFSTTSNGYRDATGLDEQKLSMSHTIEAGAWHVRSTMTGTLLNQETGGFVIGRDAYEDDHLRKTNPNPESYRDAWSFRAASEWSRDLASDRTLVLTPYVRKSSMQFLQHFLPGEPMERNGQTSAGLLTNLLGGTDTFSWRLGLQAEWADGDLFEDQDFVAQGSPAVVATRPLGKHYDYRVESLMGAAFYDLRWQFTEDWAVVHSLRYEALGYDYDNRMLVGNTREDGTVCTFGGCLYNRPADRDDHFDDVAGRLGIEYAWSPSYVTYATVGTGFRPPQATELYRLQRGQNVADLENETIESGELGGRGDFGPVTLDIAVYAERTRNFIFRDAAGLNVSDGRTRSWGVELETHWAATEQHAFDFVVSNAHHEYDFDRLATGGEVIEKGNEIDTAPRWLASAHWRYTPSAEILSEVEIVTVGHYFLDAANTADYDGHTLLNWRATYRVNDGLEFFVRLMNVTDEKIADRADFAFGDYRYFPGLPRQLYGGVEITF